MSTQKNLTSLYINKVDSRSTYNKMKQQGLTQDDQLYLVEEEVSIDDIPELQETLDNKVDKMSGKGLSTNDYDATEKSHVQTAYEHSQATHAPSNAEANVQSDWNVTNTSSDAYIKNKPGTGTSATSGLTKIYTATGTNTDGTMTQKAVTDALGGKSDSNHNHDGRYYTETEMDTKLSGKSDTDHTHDGRYYTETEIDTKLSGKASSKHSHIMSDVLDLNLVEGTGFSYNESGNIASGTYAILNPSSGGTGVTSITENSVLFGKKITQTDINEGNPYIGMGSLALPTTAGSFLRQGTSDAPYWSKPADVLSAIEALPLAGGTVTGRTSFNLGIRLNALYTLNDITVFDYNSTTNTLAYGYGSYDNNMNTNIYGGTVSITPKGGADINLGGQVNINGASYAMIHSDQQLHFTCNGATRGTSGNICFYKDGNYYPLAPDIQNSTAQLGTSTFRWYRLYAQNACDTSSDRRLKEDIVVFDDKYRTFFSKLNPVQYKRKNSSNDKICFGFIAQDVEKAFTESNLDAEKYDVLNKYDSGSFKDGKEYSLAYEEFIALNTMAIQDLQKENAELKSRLSALEERLEDSNVG